MVLSFVSLREPRVFVFRIFLFARNSSFVFLFTNLMMIIGSLLGLYWVFIGSPLAFFILWQAVISLFSTLTPIAFLMAIVMASTSSPSCGGTPLISRHSRRPYCSKSFTAYFAFLGPKEEL